MSQHVSLLWALNWRNGGTKISVLGPSIPTKTASLRGASDRGTALPNAVPRKALRPFDWSAAWQPPFYLASLLFVQGDTLGEREQGGEQ